jgi:hypothetical protein
MRGNANARRFALRQRLVVLAAAVLGSSYLGPAGAATLFESQDALQLRLEAPFATLLAQRPAEDYHPARLLGPFAGDGADVALDLRVRVRGKSRLELCDFPPLLLNFPADGLTGTEFEGENRLKLVTHCSRNSSYDQHLLLEYVSYRVLNLLTDSSLRVRLVGAHYVDTERARDLATRPGILLEDEERFAARAGFELYEAETVDRSRYDPHAAALLDVFQYFIGNTDWSASAGPQGDACCHNVVPVARPDGGLLPIPYDFDSAGIVNAPHALPDERLRIQNVRQRLYRGGCHAPAVLEETFAKFQAERGAITALIQQQPGLSEAVAKRTLDYIEQFYERIEDPRVVERTFEAPCKR